MRGVICAQIVHRYSKINQILKTIYVIFIDVNMLEVCLELWNEKKLELQWKQRYCWQTTGTILIHERLRKIQTNTNLLVFHYARTIRIQTQTHGSPPLNTQNQKYFFKIRIKKIFILITMFVFYWKATWTVLKYAPSYFYEINDGFGSTLK